ncbi:HlyD family type I secretion periplasmic adaptor subunit [Bradyrhizobium sp.]|uniref:HlyD family type I secretion periplasmic adaptor subunit n=1 Tax=Bradyrhizobium sp. TaxID=376 RepID=UPI001D7D3B0B|nr:HlyD family type I secretion periplasmic adaptor subunit [Bradyrhizobium sp.]MBI5322040.1 HlyD family type I secretion periplasmic adaptor subunit [Bradyrhizobium sp.]
MNHRREARDKAHDEAHDDVLERPRREPPRDVGPQGEALILELQRLRQAFERDNWNEAEVPPQRRPPLNDAGPAGAPRRRAQWRPRKKRGMGRVIEVCLEQLGLNAGAPAASRMQQPPTTPPPRAAPPQRKRKPVTLVAPVAMDFSRPGPEISSPKPPPVPVEATAREQDQPRLEAPRPPDTRFGQLIAQCRSGVAFLLAPEEPAGEGDNLASATGRNFARELKVGLRVLIAAAVLVGGWATLMPLAGAVVVPGNLVVQSNVKAIQHPAGGVVAEIPVRNGMRVKAGDLLLRLDATQAQASLQVLTKQLDEFRARSARLVAERDGLARPDLPEELAPRIGESAVKNLLSAEATLFQARASARDSQKGLLRNRIAQLNEEIAGLEAQVGSKARQLELIAGELTGVQDLYDKRLVPLPRLTALQREAARIEGERGQLTSAIAETKAKISEAQLQSVRIDQDFRTDVVKELGEVRGKEAELAERSVAARDLLDRIELRAPASGIVHQLNVHTIGGVIRAGDTVMEVVPDADDLQIEARLQPADIDQVRLGQKAFTRFPAFNQRVTPEVAGVVSYVSADISRDQQSNGSYFTVRVTLPEEERRRLAGLQLVSGMPAEVFMQTGSRTMLSYLFKPITDQLQRAFVER